MLGRRTGTEGARRAARYIADRMRSTGLTPAGDSGFIQRVPLAVHHRANATSRLQRLLDWNAYEELSAADRTIDANVVGILYGADVTARDSAIIVVAHYDHVGTARFVGDDTVFNGADDNASGVATILEVARALTRGTPPRRSVVFLLTTGEEAGLLGARWYLAHPVVPLQRTIATLVIEMTGRPDPVAGGFGHAWLTGDSRSTMGESFRSAGLSIVPDPHLSQGFFERSDNIAFARLGIPAHTLSTFGLHTDYHRFTDEAQYIDFAHLAAVAEMTVTAVRLLANGPAIQWNTHGRPRP